MLDRSIDLISPFCVQQTYEGAIDEIFNIRTTQIEVDRQLIYPTQEKDANLPQKIAISLKSDDIIFKDVRRYALGATGIPLRKKMQDI